MFSNSLFSYIRKTKTVDLLPNLFIVKDASFKDYDKKNSFLSLDFVFEDGDFTEKLGHLDFKLNHDVKNKRIIWKEFYPLNEAPDLIRLDPELLSEHHYTNKHLGTVAHMMALDYLKENVKDISSYVIHHDASMNIMSDRKKHLSVMSIDFDVAHRFDDYYKKSLDFAIKKVDYDIFKR